MDILDNPIAKGMTFVHFKNSSGNKHGQHLNSKSKVVIMDQDFDEN